MTTKMQLTAKLDQRLTMSLQLKQAITLLQYSTIELNQVIKQFIDTNPMIDLVEEPEEYEQPLYSARITSKSNHYDSDDSVFDNYFLDESLKDHLMQQTLHCHFNPREQKIAETIIDAIEDNGRLIITNEEIKRIISDELSITDYEIEQVLGVIQTFEPIGACSRSISECLLLQLNELTERDRVWEVAKLILSHASELTNLVDTKKLLKKLSINDDEYKKAGALLKTLDPDPGLKYSSDKELHAEPELYVKKVGQKWKVFLKESMSSRLKINNQYLDIINKNKKDKAFDSINSQLQEAKWFISGLQRRNETLLKVGEYIMKAQHEFLDKGLSFVKPMNIIDVSSMINMHESTVSRVTNGKYIATPWGVFELKYFLPSQLRKKDGGVCSSLTVKEMIKEIVELETRDHIHSDDDIVEKLKEKGVKIARRTIAKYRESLNILPSYQRAQIKFQQE